MLILIQIIIIVIFNSSLFVLYFSVPWFIFSAAWLIFSLELQVRLALLMFDRFDTGLGFDAMQSNPPEDLDVGRHCDGWLIQLSIIFSRWQSKIISSVLLCLRDWGEWLWLFPSSCNANSIWCFRIQKLPRLLVATTSGHLFIYNVDPLDGGECMLAQKHRWGLSVC